MSEEHNNEEVLAKPDKKSMSRRQFLNYTLGGTGAFMISLPLIFNLRFAIDPLLQEKGSVEWVKVAKADEITTEPKVFSFRQHQVDGWYESKPTFEAWISKADDGTIFALSPVCKHLGCRVDWNRSASHPNEYFCPCHGAHYTKDGEALAIAPLPLDEYEVMISDDGSVYLGGLKPNSRV